jgi:hypothetical protein
MIPAPRRSARFTGCQPGWELGAIVNDNAAAAIAKLPKTRPTAAIFGKSTQDAPAGQTDDADMFVIRRKICFGGFVARQ